MVKRVLFCFYAIPLHYNHGVALLSRLCKDAGIEVDIYMPEDLYLFQEKLRSKKYDLVGFSISILKDFNLCKPYIDLALRNGNEVALGGTFFRRNNPNEYDGRCFICRGEGELLPEFILHGDETIFNTRFVNPDIESLPLPDFEAPMRYDGDIPRFKPRKMVPYYASRGCIGKCNFCDVQHQTGVVRIRRKAKEDMQNIVNIHSPEMIFIGDETAPYYDDGWRESWEDFKFPFYAYIRADIPKETLLWLIERGMVGCAFGVESGDEAYRNDVLGKNLFDRDIYRTAEILRQHNRHFVHFYMTGTRGETNELKYKTIKFMESIGGYPVLFGYTEVKHDLRKGA